MSNHARIRQIARSYVTVPAIAPQRTPRVFDDEVVIAVETHSQDCVTTNNHGSGRCVDNAVRYVPCPRDKAEGHNNRTTAVQSVADVTWIGRVDTLPIGKRALIVLVHGFRRTICRKPWVPVRPRSFQHLLMGRQALTSELDAGYFGQSVTGVAVCRPYYVLRREHLIGAVVPFLSGADCKSYTRLST